jgi:predicted nucleic acid-binding protein
MPLIFEETNSDTATGLLRDDSDMSVWWGIWAECSVAISRLKHVGWLDEDGEERARAVLDLLAEIWTEMRPTDDLRLLAALLSKDHPLKTADALQLAAVLRWCEGHATGTAFVCLDDRLRRAARSEGFSAMPESEVAE